MDRGHAAGTVGRRVNQGGRGARAENAVADELGLYGYDVVRSAGSKGAGDLWAIHDGELLLVQVKLVSPGKRSYTQLTPDERRELLRMARRVGPWAVPVVAQRHLGYGSRPPVTMWFELTGTGPDDRRSWIPREADM